MTSPLHVKVFSIAGALSSAEASLCCREAGEKETEGARGIVHRALFIGIPSGSLHRGDSRGRTGDATPSRLIFLRSLYFALLLARVASVSVRLQSEEQGTRISPTATLATHAMSPP